MCMITPDMLVAPFVVILPFVGCREIPCAQGNVVQWVGDHVTEEFHYLL